MSEARAYKISVGRRSISDYMTSIAIIFNQGVKSVVIRGSGDNIHRAVTLYNVLKSRLGDSIKLVNVKIGSEKRGSKYVPYIEIEIERA
ncbi:MAG: DNA-binding protein [Sulfolobales archaeon]|nr:DNA-binding protein [Sulfolobales archaeon]MDW8010978.1 DNA-binding protein [Sulfolobales archaeon]